METRPAWSPGFAAPLRLEPRRSPLLAAALVAIHGAGAAALLALAWPLGLCLASAALLLAHGAWSLWRHVLRPVVRAAEWGADGRWRLLLDDGGGWAPARVEPESLVTRTLSVLCFRLAGGRRVRLPILPDAVCGELRRRLARRWRAEASRSNLGAHPSG